MDRERLSLEEAEALCGLHEKMTATLSMTSAFPGISLVACSLLDLTSLLLTLFEARAAPSFSFLLSSSPSSSSSSSQAKQQGKDREKEEEEEGKKSEGKTHREHSENEARAPEEAEEEDDDKAVEKVLIERSGKAISVGLLKTSRAKSMKDQACLVSHLSSYLESVPLSWMKRQPMEKFVNLTVEVKPGHVLYTRKEKTKEVVCLRVDSRVLGGKRR